MTSLRWDTLFAAFAMALVASASALFVGEILGQTPCNLCWFQRAFMFPLTIILAIAAFRSDATVWIYAAPLALFGWIVAGFHSLLYAQIIPEGIEPCGVGPSCSDANMVVYTIPLPYLSLAAFSAILVLLMPAKKGPSA